MPGRKHSRRPNPKSTPKEIVGSHGHKPHGPSILWPALYEHLRAKGKTKTAAAKISNAAWKKKRMGLPTNAPMSARGLAKAEVEKRRPRPPRVPGRTLSVAERMQRIEAAKKSAAKRRRKHSVTRYNKKTEERAFAAADKAEAAKGPAWEKMRAAAERAGNWGDSPESKRWHQLGRIEGVNRRNALNRKERRTDDAEVWMEHGQAKRAARRRWSRHTPGTEASRQALARVKDPAGWDDYDRRNDYKASTKRVGKAEPGEISKLDDEQQNVFGWAYVTHDQHGNVVVDKSGDFIEDVSELESAAYDFVLESRTGGANHARGEAGPIVKSTLIESVILTPEKRESMGLGPGPSGWWVGFHVHDPEVWTGVKTGLYKAFSIHGSGTRERVDAG